MPDPDDDREAGFYWISIGSLAAEVAQWETEGTRWLVIGSDMWLSDLRAADLIVLSDRLPPPALHAISTAAVIGSEI